MKIYTKTGDQGETGLLGGVRLSKGHESIEACGDLDELNSWLGWVVSQSPEEWKEPLQEIQKDVFCIGGAVAVSLGDSSKTKGTQVAPERAGELECWMDQLQEQLPPQTAFILPGGSSLACQLFLARSVCRRAERNVVRLIRAEDLNGLKDELVYLNRLSDLLFLMGRKVNVLAGQPETQWLP